MPAEAPLPDDPTLRVAAETIARAGISAEILDTKWRGVYISPEYARTVGVDPATVDRYYGISGIRRAREFRDVWSADRSSGEGWWEVAAPFMAFDVPPTDPDFEDVFDHAAERARGVAPREPATCFTVQVRFELPLIEDSIVGGGRFVYIRLHRAEGELAGMLVLAQQDIPASLAARLARGDMSMYLRMDELRVPSRRPAAVLFADLVGSGDLSRRLPSRVYFELIRSLTDLVDDAVARRNGIIGKHAGDGASALFLASNGTADAAAAAIEAAREIRATAGSLSLGSGDRCSIKIGLHWGEALMIGQVSSRGRLVVTALGDEMNEEARIESVAGSDGILASKQLIERLTNDAATAIGIDVGSLAYRPLAELSGAEKVLRDAGHIAVTEL